MSAADEYAVGAAKASLCTCCSLKKQHHCEAKHLNPMNNGNCIQRHLCRFNTWAGLIITIVALIGLLGLMGIKLPGL